MVDLKQWLYNDDNGLYILVDDLIEIITIRDRFKTIYHDCTMITMAFRDW